MQGESACDYIYVIYVISSGIISWSMRQFYKLYHDNYDNLTSQKMFQIITSILQQTQVPSFNQNLTCMSINGSAYSEVQEDP